MPEIPALASTAPQLVPAAAAPLHVAEMYANAFGRSAGVAIFEWAMAALADTSPFTSRAPWPPTMVLWMWLKFEFRSFAVRVSPDDQVLMAPANAGADRNRDIVNAPIN